MVGSRHDTAEALRTATDASEVRLGGGRHLAVRLLDDRPDLAFQQPLSCPSTVLLTAVVRLRQPRPAYCPNNRGKMCSIAMTMC